MNITRSVGDDLKPKLCGLFPESVLSALYGFFVAAVKDTFVWSTLTWEKP
jgi:hypothetical protein